MAHGVATDGNRIFVTGGSAKANSNFGPGLSEMEMCEVVDGKKPEWQLVGEMEEGRSFLGSVVLDSKVYQIGGCLSEEKSTTEVSFSCSHLRSGVVWQVWDPDTRKFSAIPRSLSKRDSQGQAVVNDEIYVIGGFDNISNRLDPTKSFSRISTFDQIPFHCGEVQPGKGSVEQAFRTELASEKPRGCGLQGPALCGGRDGGEGGPQHRGGLLPVQQRVEQDEQAYD